MSGVMLARRLRGPAVFVFTLLVIEFLDEFVFGAREAAWPMIRDDLNLSYEQIGLLLGIPSLLASVIEPFLGIYADIGKRRVIVLGGGIVFGVSLLLSALAQNFSIMLLSFILFYPASGAFVSLSQATLMDIDPKRHEHNMARWTFAGSVGVVGGALVLGALVILGAGWREFFLICMGLTVVLVAIMWRMPIPEGGDGEETIGLFAGIRVALGAMRRSEVIRWGTLLQFSDLLLDGLHGYLALYFVDVVGVGEAQAGVAVAVWTGVGLVGDLLLIPLLERMRGLTYLRVSAVIELILYPLLLVVPSVELKFVILGMLGFFNAGWYSILQGQLYSSMPGQSGTVLAVNNFFGLVGSLIPAAIGFAAGQWGLAATMWFLLFGPIALLVGIPRNAQDAPLVDD